MGRAGGCCFTCASRSQRNAYMVVVSQAVSCRVSTESSRDACISCKHYVIEKAHHVMSRSRLRASVPSLRRQKYVGVVAWLFLRFTSRLLYQILKVLVSFDMLLNEVPRLTVTTVIFMLARSDTFFYLIKERTCCVVTPSKSA